MEVVALEYQSQGEPCPLGVTTHRKDLKPSFTEGHNPFRFLWGKEQRLGYLQQRCTQWSRWAPRLANLRWGGRKVATSCMAFVCHTLACQHLHATRLWRGSACGAFHRTPMSSRHNSKWPTDRERLGWVQPAGPAPRSPWACTVSVRVGSLQHLIGQFSDVFSSVPGKTQLVRHDIKTPPGVIVKQRPYRIPEGRRQAIKEEIQQMLKLGVIETSRSPWSSPIVLVPKPDGTLRFCNDFRRLNEVSEFDGYPMPRVDELLDRLGRARYISTLDLKKGYWQIPLSDSAKPKTAFSTPSGHWQYRILPFCLHGAPATFQRLMDIVLCPHQQYAAAYLDDVVVHSEHWEDHLDHLRRVLMELRRAGLAANPRKCHLALFEAKYLGFRVRRGLIKRRKRRWRPSTPPPRPSTKTQVTSVS